MIAEGPKEQAKRSSAAIGDFIREQREQAQVSVRQLARLAGVSNPYLSQIERGMRKLESRGGNQELIGAILADEALAERQKQVLLDIYDSFRRENDTASITTVRPTEEEPTYVHHQ